MRGGYIRQMSDGNFRATAVLYKSDRKLRIHVGPSMERIFSMDELPDCLRQQLAMVHAWDWTKPLQASSDFFLSDTQEPNGYLNVPLLYPEECEDVGWVIKDTSEYTIYVLVLSGEAIDELRGEVSRG